MFKSLEISLKFVFKQVMSSLMPLVRELHCKHIFCSLRDLGGRQLDIKENAAMPGKLFTEKKVCYNILKFQNTNERETKYFLLTH